MADTSTSGARTVRTEEHGGVLVITIDRPERRRAVDGAIAQAVADAFDRLDSRDGLASGVWCVQLQGAEAAS
ncbi:hypothetical protein [Streptomyces sp. NPDC051286]|uniref:hypothetical protein n=1 Tax=Streptomyces sp. NPDC051286 TaxID=3365647 RepID=UPI0037A1853F